MVFYKFGRKYDVIENATYGALNRWLFLLPYFFIILQHFTSGIGKNYMHNERIRDTLKQ